MTDTTLREQAREILLHELEVDTKEYTPDQGMPPIIYELNAAQLDYLIDKIEAAVREEERERCVKVTNKLLSRYGITAPTMQSLVLNRPQFMAVLAEDLQALTHRYEPH